MKKSWIRVIGDIEIDVTEDEFNIYFLRWIEDNDWIFAGHIVPHEEVKNSYEQKLMDIADMVDESVLHIDNHKKAEQLLRLGQQIIRVASNKMTN